MMKIKYIIILNIMFFCLFIQLINVNAFQYYSSTISNQFNITQNDVFTSSDESPYFPNNNHIRNCLFSYGQYTDDINLGNTTSGYSYSIKSDYDNINNVYYSQNVLVLDSTYLQYYTQDINNNNLDNFTFQEILKPDSTCSRVRYQFWNYGDLAIDLNFIKNSSTLTNITLSINGIFVKNNISSNIFENEFYFLITMNKLTKTLIIYAKDIITNNVIINYIDTNIIFSLNSHLLYVLYPTGKLYVFAEGSNILFNRSGNMFNFDIDENFNTNDIFEFVSNSWILPYNFYSLVDWKTLFSTYNINYPDGTIDSILKYSGGLFFNENHKRYDILNTMGFKCKSNNIALPSYFIWSSSLQNYNCSNDNVYSLIRVNNSDGLALSLTLTESTIGYNITCTMSVDSFGNYINIAIGSTYNYVVYYSKVDNSKESVIGFLIKSNRISFVFGNRNELTVYTLRDYYDINKFTYIILNPPYVKSEFCICQTEIHKIPEKSLSELLIKTSGYQFQIVNSSFCPYLSEYIIFGGFSLNRFFRLTNILNPVLSKNCTYFYVNQSRISVYCEINKNIVNPNFNFYTTNDRFHLSNSNINCSNVVLDYGFRGYYSSNNFDFNFSCSLSFIISDFIEVVSNSYNSNLIINIDTDCIYVVEPFTNWDFISFILNLIIPLVIIFIIPFVLFFISNNKWIFVISLVLTPIIMYVINQISISILIAIEPLAIIIFIYMLKHNNSEINNRGVEE